MKLANQIALVTGASSGIGKAIAVALAHEGVTLALTGRKRSTLQAVVDEMAPPGSLHRIYEMDLTKDDDVIATRDRLKSDHGQINLVIHSAGMISMGNAQRAGIEDLDKQYRTNLRGPYLLTQLTLPLLKSGAAQVVFINSTLGLQARSGAGQYAATK